jgi:5,10-methylenetetrahydrofolate reductase
MGVHADAKLVRDIDSIQALQLTSHLMQGKDPEGEDLEGAPNFFMGATFNPFTDSIETEIQRIEQKRDSGAQFFQTQAVFDIHTFENFIDRISDLHVKFLVGIMPLRGPRNARFLNENVPGINIPDEHIKRLESAGKGLKEDEARNAMREEGLLIASETIRLILNIKDIAGLHIMAIGREENIPELVKRTGLSSRRRLE